MIARMPEWSSRLTSLTVKPSRLSISSCDSTRSPEFLPPNSRPPSSTIAAHCSAIDGGAGQVDQHVRHFDVYRWLRRRRHFGMRLAVVVMAEEKKPGDRAAGENGEHADRRDDELELALGGCGRLRAFARTALCPF